MTADPNYARIPYRNGPDLARVCACVGPQCACTPSGTGAAHWGSVPDEERLFLAAGFGAELKRLRTAAALTQARLGDLAGFRGDHIGALERGKRRPSVNAVKALCRIIAPEAEREAVETRLATLAGDSLREYGYRKKQAKDNRHRRAALASAENAHRKMKSALRDAERRGEVTSGSLRNIAEMLGQTVDRLRADVAREPAGIKGITPKVGRAGGRAFRLDKPRSRSLKDIEAWLDSRRSEPFENEED